MSKPENQNLMLLLRESEEEIGTRNISYKHVGDRVFHRQSYWSR